MALPSLGETYSLLADVRTSDIKRQRDEERRYRKDARRDQLKAALLQPIVGAAATTGLKVLGEVASRAILPDAGRRLEDLEVGKRLARQAKYQASNARKVGNFITKIQDPDKLIKDNISEIQQAYAVDMGVSDFKSLSETQKTAFNAILAETNSDFKNEVNQISSRLQDIYTTVSNTKDAEQIEAALRKADNYIGKTPGARLGTFVIDRLFSILPGKERTDLKREAVRAAVVGQTPESEWTSEERYYIDVLSGVTKDGKPLEGPSSRDHGLLSAVEKDLANLNNTLYGVLSRTKGFTNEVQKAAPRIAAALSLRDDQSKVNETNIFKDISLENSNSIYSHANTYAEVFSQEIFTAKDNKKIVATLSSIDAQKFNTLIERIKKSTGLNSEEIQTSLESLAPQLQNKVNDGLKQYFLDSAKNKNINPFVVGDKNIGEIKKLYANVMYEALEQDLLLVPETFNLVGMSTGPEVFRQISFKTDIDYSTLNASRFLKSFNPDSPRNSTEDIARQVGKETDYKVVINKLSLSLTKTIEEYRTNNASDQEIKTAVKDLYDQFEILIPKIA